MEHLEPTVEKEWEDEAGARHLLKFSGGSSGRSSGKTSSKSGAKSSGSSSSRSAKKVTYRSTQRSSGIAVYSFYAINRPNRYRNGGGGSVHSEDSKCTIEAVEDTKELILDASDGLATDSAESPGFGFTPAEELSLSAVKTNRVDANNTDLQTATDAVNRKFELMREVSCDSTMVKLSWYGYNLVTNPAKAMDMDPTTQYNAASDSIDFQGHNLTCKVSDTRVELCQQVTAMEKYDLSMGECMEALIDVGSCSEYTASSGTSLVPSVMLLTVLWKMICRIW